MAEAVTLTYAAGRGHTLVQLPTGGRLELHDDMLNGLEFRASTFNSEVRLAAGEAHQENEQPLRLAPAVTADEKAGLDEWAVAAHAPVLSRSARCELAGPMREARTPSGT